MTEETIALTLTAIFTVSLLCLAYGALAAEKAVRDAKLYPLRAVKAAAIAAFDLGAAAAGLAVVFFAWRGF